MDYFLVEGGWLFFDLVTGRRATAAETKLMAPPGVELFLCPVTATSHTLGMIALEHGFGCISDLMAGQKPSKSDGITSYGIVSYGMTALLL